MVDEVEDEEVTDSEDADIEVNFAGKRPLNWLKTVDDEKDDIYIDKNSGLVATDMDGKMVVYAIYEMSTIRSLTDEAIKYANKHKLEHYIA